MKIFRAFFWVGILGILLWCPTLSAEPTPSPSVIPTPTAASPIEPVTQDPSVGTAAEFGNQSVDFTWLFLKTIFAMVVVIALAVIILRYVLPKISLTRNIKSGTDIQIVDRVPLDSKRILYVLHVEGRRLLVSASEHSVSLITELESDLEKSDA